MLFTASGRHNRTFHLLDAGGQSLATLDYPTWYAPRQAIITSGTQVLQTKMRGFFRNGINLLSGDEVVASTRWVGMGRLKIEFADGRQYTFRRVGFFNGYMALVNDAGQELVNIRQVNRWALLNFTFSIETDDNYREVNDPALLLLLIFCINYMRAVAYAS